MSKQLEIRFIELDEKLVESIIKDLFSFFTISLCVYVSRDSNFWTFITGSMFLMVLWAYIDKKINKQNVFKNKEDAKKWIESLNWNRG